LIYQGLVLAVFPVAVLLALSFRFPCPTSASSALCSRKLAHRFASDSFSFPDPLALPLSEKGVSKNSLLSAGELGVRWKDGVGGRRRVLWLEVAEVGVEAEAAAAAAAAAPGRARPAFSRCSSFQPSRPEMT